jgi:limonene-1,2-epoxide hydrolase
MQDNERIVREFIAAWPRMDAKELASWFTEDGVYHNIPMEPVAGRAAIEQLIAGFTGMMSGTQWDIVSIGCDGDRVYAERIDHWHMGERSFGLPCVGVFEMRGGKIAAWRDYFDMAAFQRGMGGG